MVLLEVQMHAKPGLSLPRFQGQCLESCFYTDPMKTGEAHLDRGREEGEALGEVQGEARGRALGEVAVTLRLLNRRCGPGSTSHG